MPFPATCLHCRQAKFLVPDCRRGTFARCPRCGEESMLVPDEGTGPALVDYKPFEPEPKRRRRQAVAEVEEFGVPAEVPAPAAETRPADIAPTRPLDAPTRLPPAPSRGVAPEAEPDAAQPDAAHFVALAALAAFGVAVLATQLPYGRFVAAPLAAAGLAVAGLTLFGLETRRWLGWAGVGLNAAALTLVLLLPSWLGLSGWVPAADPEAGPKSVTAVGRDGSPPTAAAWVDAAQAVWEQGDVRVAVVAVEVAPLDPAAKTPEARRERGLRVTLRLTNVGVARAIDFDGWAGPPADAPAAGPTLTTAAGPALAPRPSANAGRVAVFPGKSAGCVVWFAAPDAAGALRLELPAKAFGGPDPVRFAIPPALIGGLPPRKAP